MRARTRWARVVAAFLFTAAAGAQSCGDCNGDGNANILDALVGAQHGAGILVLAGAEFCACDVDSSGGVTVIDALRVAQTSAGLAIVLACTFGCTPGPGTPGYPGEGTGTHYWIDATGGLDTNPGTMAMPWATAERIEQASFAPGDLVHFVAGTYPVSGGLRVAGLTGTAAAWIGLHAEGAVTLVNSAAQNVVNIEGCQYLFLRGFEITHDNGGAPYGSWDGVDGVKLQTAPSDHISIDGCRIHDVGNVGVSSQAPVVTDVRVLGCEIHDCYTGIYWGYYEDPVKRFAHDGRIAGCYIHDCPPVDLDGTGYGIQIKGGSRGNIIEDNVLVRTAGSARAAIAVYHISTDQGVETARNVIRRNFVRAGRGEGIYAAEGALIENNIIYGCTSTGVNVSRRDTGGWGIFYGNLTVVNNTVFEVADPSGVGLFAGSGAFAIPLVISSNLLAVTGGGQLSLQLSAGFTGVATANHCRGATSGPAAGVIALADLASLLSTTYGSQDFLFPAPAGALVGAADAAAATADDFNAGARDATPDAGAYESTGGGNPGWTLTDGFKP